MNGMLARAGLSLLLLANSFAIAAEEYSSTPNAPTQTEQAAPWEAARAALKGGRFGELEASLGAAQAAYEGDTNAEHAMHEAFGWLKVTDPELEALFDRWVAEYPRSYSARLARGQYLYAMARAWRGTAWSNQTHPARFEHMNQYLERAYRDLGDASALTAKPIRAYRLMILAAQLVGGREVATELLDRAVKTDRFATSAYQAYAELLTPRWGGSHAEMRSLADRLEAENHPQLSLIAKDLRGDILADQADQRYFAGDRLGALKGYQAAVAEHPRHIYSHCMLGSLFNDLGQTDNALNAVNAGLKLDPYNTDCLLRRVRVLHTARRSQAMLADLRLAAALDHPAAVRQLGLLLVDGGEGIPANVPEGIRWLERAAYFWDIQPLLQLGLTFERGAGVRADHPRAVGYYRACANLRNVQCENNLGIMLWYGRGAKADPEGAARLWIRVHKQGEWRGGHNLEYFFPPLERLRLAFLYGPGKWALAPLATTALLILGAMLIAWLLIRRPFAPRAKRQ